jgi:hypothetical protein
MLLDSTAVLEVTGDGYVAVALMILGGGLLVGAFWGRARGLIWLGLLLTFALAATVLTPVSFTHGLGDRAFRPGSRAEAEAGFKLGAGEMHVDLTRVTDVSVPIELGAGELTVVVPPEAEARVRVRVAAGEIHMPPTGFEDAGSSSGSTRTSGLNLDRTVRLSGIEGGGRIDVDIRVGTGEVHVVRGAWATRPEVSVPTPEPQPEPIPEEVFG